MSPRIRRQVRPLIALSVLVVLSTAVAGYILSNQRLRFPLLEPAAFQLLAELSTAQAVMPGQGQTVRVSGVRIGDIGDVELRDGRAIVHLDIDPEFDDLVRTDATAVLRPRTGLKDMFLELDPGSDVAPVAREGWTIPVANTLPDVDLDEITQQLDDDTRSYLQQLVGGAGEGLRGNGDVLNEVLRRFEPTHRDLARVTARVAARRDSLRRLVRSLRRISDVVAERRTDASSLVSNSAAALDSFAREESAVSEALAHLPGALRDTRMALDHVGALGRELRPASDELRPVVRALPAATTALRELAREATAPLREQLRPFAREARPLARALRRPAADLEKAAAPANETARLVNRFFNMLGHNRDGREGPDDPDRDEGFLFWTAWGSHVSSTVWASADAHGPFRATTEQGSCASLQAFAESLGQGDPLLGTALGGLQGVFSDPRVCGASVTRATPFGRRLLGGRLDRKALRAAHRRKR